MDFIYPLGIFIVTTVVYVKHARDERELKEACAKWVKDDGFDFLRNTRALRSRRKDDGFDFLRNTRALRSHGQMIIDSKPDHTPTGE